MVWVVVLEGSWVMSFGYQPCSWLSLTVKEKGSRWAGVLKRLLQFTVQVLGHREDPLHQRCPCSLRGGDCRLDCWLHWPSQLTLFIDWLRGLYNSVAKADNFNAAPPSEACCLATGFLRRADSAFLHLRGKREFASAASGFPFHPSSRANTRSSLRWSPKFALGVATGSETPQIRRTPVLLLEVPTWRGQRRERKSLLNRNLSSHLTAELVTVNQGSEDDLRPRQELCPE